MAIIGLLASIYVDHNVDPPLARDRGAEHFDPVSALEIGRRQATDEQRLAFATTQSRVLVTHDLKDFPRLAEE